MINPAPYNAEAPPAALDRGDHPHRAALRAQQLRRARRTTAPWRSAAPSDNPITLTLDDLRALPAHEHAVTLECAGNGRLDMRPLPTGEPWGDYAVSTARWTGRPAARRAGAGAPVGRRVDVRFEGADHGAYHLKPVLPETSQDDLTFERALPLALAADPASGILIAYEMNGEPLGPDHGAPFRVIVPHWYAVASVKWLKRIEVLTEPFTGEFQTGHYMYQWPDRPQEPVDLMRVRARITDPAPGLDHRRRALHRPRQGLVGHRARHQRRGQPHRRRRLAPRAAATARRPVPLAGLDLHLGRRRRRPAHPPRPGHRRRRQRATRRTAVEPARLRQQRHRGHLRRPPLTAAPGHASRPTPGVGRPQQPWSRVPSLRASLPSRRAWATFG